MKICLRLPLKHEPDAGQVLKKKTNANALVFFFTRAGKKPGFQNFIVRGNTSRVVFRFYKSLFSKRRKPPKRHFAGGYDCVTKFW